MSHTYHPNTFGILYGRTTKTACGTRVPTKDLVKPLETDCIRCQDVVLSDMLSQQELFNVATEIAKSAGYQSVADWARRNAS